MVILKALLQCFFLSMKLDEHRLFQRWSLDVGKYEHKHLGMQNRMHYLLEYPMRQRRHMLLVHWRVDCQNLRCKYLYHPVRKYIEHYCESTRHYSCAWHGNLGVRWWQLLSIAKHVEYRDRRHLDTKNIWNESKLALFTNRNCCT